MNLGSRMLVGSSYNFYLEIMYIIFPRFFIFPFISISVSVLITVWLGSSDFFINSSMWIGSWDRYSIIVASVGESGVIFLFISTFFMFCKFNISKMSFADVIGWAPSFIDYLFLFPFLMLCFGVL